MSTREPMAMLCPLSATYARKVGTNPGATAQGMDSDGTNTRSQYWLQFSMWF